MKKWSELRREEDESEWKKERRERGRGEEEMAGRYPPWLRRHLELTASGSSLVVE